jgi:hypothetical protein
MAVPECFFILACRLQRMAIADGWLLCGFRIFYLFVFPGIAVVVFVSVRSQFQALDDVFGSAEVPLFCCARLGARSSCVAFFLSSGGAAPVLSACWVSLGVAWCVFCFAAWVHFILSDGRWG